MGRQSSSLCRGEEPLEWFKQSEDRITILFKDLSSCLWTIRRQ